MNVFSSTDTAYRWLGTPPRQLPAGEVEAARRFRRECAAWMQDAGVLAYAVGDHDPHHHGALQEPVLRFYVKQKKAVQRLKSGLIPAVITTPGGRRVRTDVLEASVPQACCGPGKLVYGQAVGANDSGTVTCVAYALAKPTQFYLLTAWHVLCGPNGRANQPFFCGNHHGGVVSGKYQGITLDSVKNLARVQSFDGALGLLNGTAFLSGNPGLGLNFNGLRQTPVAKGEELFSYGSESNQRRRGTVMETMVTEPIGYNSGYATFSEMIKTTLISRPGDSGAPVTDAAGNLVGLAVADDSRESKPEAQKRTWIQPIREVFDEYGIALVTGGAGATAFSGLAQPKDAIDILARTIWGEARGEPAKGRLAVCWVVVNRAAAQPPVYGDGVIEVCLKQKQFSCWNPGNPNRQKMLQLTTADSMFRECLELARAGLAGTLAPDPTHGARYLHTTAISPRWARGKTPAVTIGKHVFYR